MRKYEGLFAFPPDSGPDARKSQEQSLEDCIKKHKGKISTKNDLGKLPVGYLIRKKPEVQFLFVEFEMESSQGDAFKKALELQPDLCKYMITRKVEHAAPRQASARKKKPSPRPVAKTTRPSAPKPSVPKPGVSKAVPK